MKHRMNMRTEKVFITFLANTDNFFINVQKIFHDKNNDLTSDSHEKYEKAHDILLVAIKALKQNWYTFLENQSA